MSYDRQSDFLNEKQSITWRIAARLYVMLSGFALTISLHKQTNIYAPGENICQTDFTATGMSG